MHDEATTTVLARSPLVTLEHFLESVARATTLAGMSIAAGKAHQELSNEWTGCPSGCECDECAAFDLAASTSA
jgi:hypothetical protein